jgi:hypothetical protein
MPIFSKITFRVRSRSSSWEAAPLAALALANKAAHEGVLPREDVPTAKVEAGWLTKATVEEEAKNRLAEARESKESFIVGRKRTVESANNAIGGRIAAAVAVTAGSEEGQCLKPFASKMATKDRERRKKRAKRLSL